MVNDPFAEPGDTEGTVIRPRPSGTAGSAPSASVTPRGTTEARSVPKVGDNALVAAASPVLAAAIRIANDRAQPPDPERLRAAMTKAIKQFETDALHTGLDTRSLRAARYAMCAMVDDLVLSTPWGSQSSWVQHSMTSVFSNEVIGGERFFDILKQMQADMGHHAPVVELMYLCTSLGFEGRYRVLPRGVAELTELRDGVYRTLRQRRGDFERDLSPHWRGVDAGARSLANRIPIWARALATVALAGAMYMVFAFLLAGTSDTAFAELSLLPPKDALPMRRAPVRVPAVAPPPEAPPAPPAPTAFSQRLRQFLAPEIKEGLVTVLEDAQTVTVRLANRNMFGSGQAVLGASYPPLLSRIGDALETEPGQVTVFGYTDNQAIRTARFPSNFELSQARADAVTLALKARVKDPARIGAKGKGDSDPIAPNATPEGRQQNRRTEIVLTPHVGRAMTGFIGRIARSRWFRTGLAVAVLMLLVWFLGPLIGFGTMHPFETEIARWITIAALFVLWLVSNLFQELHASKRDRALASGIAGTSPEVQAAAAKTKETERASAEEVALLTDRLTKAMQSLKKSKLGGSRKRLAAMPWYMFIGPPGAGKTTALLNCGLRFPLETAKQPIAGVGGTRNCDWMFTDEAVLIDTAGRYTTQDSSEAVDSAAWLGFLKLLKKHRTRRPLNGVLVAISLSDLATQPETERQAHARAIRHRVRELHETLGLRLPVYVLFTKADLIAGFSEFFDAMGKEERDQVWGLTFPVDEGTDEEGAVAGFRTEFDLLLGRLNDRMLERVHQEPDIRRRRLIYGFPQQVASLRDVAADFLTEAFRPSRLEARPLLRGVYLTSGTQEGNPIDRLLGTLSTEFGLARQSVAAPTGPGKSYFLGRLLRTVVFGEASLAGLDAKVERRARWISIGAYAGCTVLLLGLAGTWLLSYVGNIELIAQVHAAAATYNAQFLELQKRGPNDQELAAAIPSLDTLHDMRGGYSQREWEPPVGLTFGLYQGTKLSRAAQDAYVNALNKVLLPRLMTRVEAQLAARMNNVDVLYQTLKVYLVLGRQGPLDRELVSLWMQNDLLQAYPGEEGQPIREALMEHVDALLRQPLQPPPVNDALVAQARRILNQEPLAEYSYNRLMRSKRVLAIPAWTVAENGGPGSGRVFFHRSGKPLDSGLPGIYTWAGYHNVLLPLLATITQDISEDAWVLGREKRDVQGTIRDTNRLRRDVLGLYFDDYARRWDALIADIGVKPTRTPQETLDQLSLLSAPASPLRDLFTAIDQQVQLSRPAATDAAVAAASARTARVGQRAAGFAQFEARSGLTIRQNELVNIFSEAFGNDPAGKPIDPAKRVDDHFKALHDFVAGAENKPSGLETAIAKILALYQGLNGAAAGGSASPQGMLSAVTGGGPAGTPGPAAQLQDVARGAPPEIAGVLSQVSRDAVRVAGSAATADMASAWETQVVPLCKAAFERYPFVAASKDDVPVDDFTTLLGPGGKMETFFNQYLKAFVDTSQKPWKFTAAVPPGLSPGSLAEFEKAAQIREGLFSNGPAIAVRFTLLPVSLDASVGQISLDIAAQTMTYAHEPPQSQPFTWPGPGGKTGVRVTMTPTGGGNAVMIERDGPWALLRLVDGRIAGGAQPDKFRVTFPGPGAGGGGSAVFELTASSVRNPFTLTALRSFRCPPKL